MVIKIYSGVGQGESLYKAIIKTGDNSYNPQLIEKWIEDQQESYMGNDWDSERIAYIIWEMEYDELIVFLNKIGVSISSVEVVWNIQNGNKTLNDTTKKFIECDREIFKLWLDKATEQKHKDMIDILEKKFIDDLENKRDEWSYQRASEDYDTYLSDIDEDEDQQVAEFFNIPLEVMGVVIEDTEFDLSEIEFCKNCYEAIITEKMQADYAEDGDDKYDDTKFYCCLCGSYYKYDMDHLMHNEHITKEEIIARRV